MKKFDVLVIGAGTGLEIVSFAAGRGMKVALVEEGPMGGTCLNRGCIPSKMLIHSADVANTIRTSGKFGIKSSIEIVDFATITKRVSSHVNEEAEQIEKGIRNNKNVTLYKTKGKFTGNKIMQVGAETITADKIFIIGGTRPHIPQIKGLNSIKYLTSKEALRLEKQPKHMVIIGGGYIACELAYFYKALGTKVTMLVRHDSLLDKEDGEIAERFKKEFTKQHTVLFQTEAEEFSPEGNMIHIKIKGETDTLKADQVLIATGTTPNTDTIDVLKTDVKTDEKGYVKVNQYLETSVEGIWALGDIVGILPFKHTANHQAGYAIRNAFLDKHIPVDYHAIAHAVFSSPQVAGVGKTEEELQKENIPYKVGKYELKDTAMGEALQENGLVKVLVDKKTDEILGCHIVGPDASTLIHEAVIAMKATGKTSAITDSVYVHPALSEWIQRAFLAIE